VFESDVEFEGVSRVIMKFEHKKVKPSENIFCC
jgi:hypothetical protein